MKKTLLIASRVLFAVVIAFCVFKTFSILADTNIFEITKIEVKDKSKGVVVNSVGLSEGQLQNDIIFSAKDDYIKYNITIKNTSNDDYTIKSITDNNDSTNLEYTYEDLTNTLVKSKNEKTFELQIKYVEETTGLYISNKPVSLTLTYEKGDGTTGSETITNNDGTSSSTVTPASDLSEEDEDIVNPNTGDNINKYIIIGLLSFVGLIISITKEKQLFKTLVVIGLFMTLVIPFGTKADTEAFIIKFSTNKIQNTHVDLISGPEFNLLIQKLSSGNEDLEIFHYADEYEEYYAIIDPNYTEEDAEYYFWNDVVTAFEKATDEEYNAVKDLLTDANLISTAESSNPAYMWFDDDSGTIYYYSKAKIVVTNEDSAIMFMNIGTTSNLDLTLFDTINTTNMAGMFRNDDSLVSLNLGDNFDTSNVTNMMAMFAGNNSLGSLNLGDNFDTSNVTNMMAMFGDTNVEALDLGDKFDTSNVTNMDYMFGGNRSLISLNLGDKFNTSNVTTMRDMFYCTLSLISLDLGDKFDTSNVTDMYDMFSFAGITQTLNLGDKFDTSKVTNMANMFNGLKATTLILGDKFDTSNVTDMSYMFAFMENLVSLDLGTKFNTSKVTNMVDMFCNMPNLKTIYSSQDFDLSSLENSARMFFINSSLVGQNGTKFSSGHIDATYARIDDPEHDKPGYFTRRSN